MSKFIKIAKKNQIKDKEVKQFTINKKVIAIAQVHGEILAFDDNCTHANCLLSNSFLEESTITCFCHGAQFDIKTGKVLAPPATEPLRVYKTKVEGEEILIEI